MFTCVPNPAINEEDEGEVIEVVWRKFSNLSRVQEFQDSGMGFNDAVIFTEGNFTVSGEMNSTLMVLNDPTAEPENVAYYYVPSFRVENSSVELVTAETLIYGE